MAPTLMQAQSHLPDASMDGSGTAHGGILVCMLIQYHRLDVHYAEGLGSTRNCCAVAVDFEVVAVTASQTDLVWIYFSPDVYPGGVLRAGFEVG